MTSPEYLPLATQFRHDGYDFKQIKREGDVAMFEKKRPNWAIGEIEVVVIQRHKAKTFPGERKYPAREAMPPAEMWGEQGWTFMHTEQAKAEGRFQQLVEARANGLINPSLFQ